MQDERYYFCMEGSIQGEIEPTGSEIETNLGNGRWGEIKMNISKNSETWNLGGGGY